MGDILSIIISCMSIGIMLSAPMGPIGILCVQRTLNNGRQSGFYTGVGAAISDLIYCLLAGLGLSIVTNFIEENVNLLQVVGAAILVVYSLYMIFHNPLKGQETPTISTNPTKDMVTGFFMTLSNPLILFLVLPLFARFSFPRPNYTPLQIALGYAFIVVGALLWWTAITYVVNKVRSRFNINSMITINRIMGVILLIMSIYGIATGVGKLINIL